MAWQAQAPFAPNFQLSTLPYYLSAQLNTWWLWKIHSRRAVGYYIWKVFQYGYTGRRESIFSQAWPVRATKGNFEETIAATNAKASPNIGRYQFSGPLRVGWWKKRISPASFHIPNAPTAGVVSICASLMYGKVRSGPIWDMDVAFERRLWTHVKRAYLYRDFASPLPKGPLKIHVEHIKLNVIRYAMSHKISP